MQINSSFIRLSSADFLVQALEIAAALAGNPAFPEPWLASVPSLMQINTDIATYEAAMAAASAGDRNRIADRHAARKVVQADLTRLAAYLQTVSDGDRTVLGTSGFPLRKPLSRTTLFQPPAAPANLVIAHGILSGTLSVSCDRMYGVGSYEMQVSAADPTVEASWNPAGIFKNSQRMTLQGLAPGKICSVRLRAVGTAGPGAWTAPSSLMVL